MEELSRYLGGIRAGRRTGKWGRGTLRKAGRWCRSAWIGTRGGLGRLLLLLEFDRNDRVCTDFFDSCSGSKRTSSLWLVGTCSLSLGLWLDSMKV